MIPCATLHPTHFYPQPHFHFSYPPSLSPVLPTADRPAPLQHVGYITSQLWALPIDLATRHQWSHRDLPNLGRAVILGLTGWRSLCLCRRKKHDMMALDKGCSENPIDLEIFRCSATTGRNHRIHEKNPLSSSSSSSSSTSILHHPGFFYSFTKTPLKCCTCCTSPGGLNHHALIPLSNACHVSGCASCVGTAPPVTPRCGIWTTPQG